MTFQQIARLGDESTSIVIALRRDRVEFLHFGPPIDAHLANDAALYDPPLTPSSFDGVVAQHLLPSAVEGWLGTPGLEISRGDMAIATDLTATRFEVESDRLFVEQEDLDAGVRVVSTVRFHPSGIFTVDHELRNTGDGVLRLARLGVVAPVSGPAAEIIETIGRWTRETHPQRHELRIGRWSRQTRQGRSGHNAPVLFALGSRGAGFRSGEVWAAHLAFSSDAEHYVEVLPSGVQAIGASVLLGPAEVLLEPGASYATPAVLLAYSDRGLDGLAARFHGLVRASLPRAPRRVTLNSWEAVYFDHDPVQLGVLAERAARVGVERFVLDDGWFQGRRDDTTSLGDWVVDPEIWPDGLHPLVEHVTSLGMEFGLWIEPEMVSPRSRLAAQHPDWISGLGGRPQRPWRSQQLLDLTRPEAWEHVHRSISALVSEYDLTYVKWDMNRDSTTIGSGGRRRTAAQTEAVYALIDRLVAEFPGLQIENCSSGGARVDIGMMSRTHRLWASDSNDPLEREAIQQWTLQLVSPELIGSHVGAPVSHTTQRAHSLSFRIATSILFDMGIEWNLLDAGPEDLRELSEAIRLHKRLRPLIGHGDVVRSDDVGADASLSGRVARDKRHAAFVLTKTGTGPLAVPAPVRFPGLAADLRYTVSSPLRAASRFVQGSEPQWLEAPAIVPGSFLMGRGLPVPHLLPAQAMVFELVAE